MIFYVNAPDIKIDFTKLNECCTTRLEYFIQYSKPESRNDVENIVLSNETIIPGTMLDRIGHYMLRCLCLCNKSLKSFILTNEVRLFMERWDSQYYKQTLVYMRQLFRDIQSIKKNFTCKKYGLLDVLESLSLHLKNESTFNHVFNECSEYCRLYNLRGDVDKESVFFPPCMGHLQQTLRVTHRLSHNSRYMLSIFLKDIGMEYCDAIEFWKNEYSKVSAGCTSCKHSWQENNRKYTYSIKHMYGLVGSRINRSISSCSNIQKKSINIMDEGICPFSHFDENNLTNLLQKIIPNDSVTNIMDLVKRERACDACKLYANYVINNYSLQNFEERSEITLNYETPVEYYHVVKKYIAYE